MKRDALEDPATRLVADLTHALRYALTGAPDHEGRFEDGVWENWSRTYAERPVHVVAPGDEAALCAAVASAQRLRVVGGGHSFNATPLCADTMLTLDAMASPPRVDPARRRVSLGAGVRVRDLNRALWAQGWALPVLGSTDAQSLGGLVATDLHGTGRRHGFLSQQTTALRVIGADGVARDCVPGDALFHAAIGGLGACGVVSEVELEVVPAFHMVKTTQMVSVDALPESVDAALDAHDHVSFYFVGGAEAGGAARQHTWDRVDAPLTPDWTRDRLIAELKDFAISAALPDAATLLAELEPDSALSHLLAPPHRVVMPSSDAFGRKLFYLHDELEHGVPHAAWVPCLEAVLGVLRARDFFSIVEVRFTDDRSAGWLGPGVGRRTAYIELATPLAQPRDEVYAEIERVLVDFGGQPHLGKWTRLRAHDLRRLHGDRFDRFDAVRRTQDPEGKFMNDALRALFDLDLDAGDAR